MALIPDKAWKKTRHGEGRYIGETVIASIGQGYVLSTPLQLAVMTARIVNGGKMVYPLLTRRQQIMTTRTVSRPSPEWEDSDIPQAHLDLVMRGMDAAVNHPDGDRQIRQLSRKKDFCHRRENGHVTKFRRISAQERQSGIRKSRRDCMAFT